MRLLLLGVLLAGSVSSRAEDGLCLSHVVVPNYPSIVRYASLQGSVILAVSVAADGHVSSVSTSGDAHKLLRATAAENLKSWTFCTSDRTHNETINYV
jgi:hypothetical protein